MACFVRNSLQLLLYSWLFAHFSPGVFCFSELYFSKEPRDTTVVRKDSVVLDCQAEGELPIQICWLKNGFRLSKSERIYPLANGSLFISEMEQRKGERSDEGLYQCLAQNKHGAILSQKARLTLAGISTFTRQPSSVAVTTGSVARFVCRISGAPPPIVTWEFNRATLPLATDRIAVLPSGVLQIQAVGLWDAGKYRCVAANVASRRWSAEATLTVTPAPFPKAHQRPRIVAGPQNATVLAHGSALLECVAVGNPQPLISWSRADQKAIDVYNTKVLGNGNLLISDVKRQHGGVYVCRATTPGTRDFALSAANVTVLVPPSLEEWPESLTRPRAGTGRFVCRAVGFPPPSITWLKNGEPVRFSGRIKMYNSKLVINQIISEDDAIYQCQAENELGSVLSTARLTVVMSEDRPSAPRDIRADTVSSSAILLAWERPSYNAEKVIAYSIHYMKAEGPNNEEYQVVIGNDTTRYIIDDLEPAQNYTFYIVAYMPMGASRLSERIVKHTLEDVPLRAPELSLTSRSPTDIQVSWQPLSPKLSRGYVSAYRLWYRAGAEGAVVQMDLPGNQTQRLLKGLQSNTAYLLRIAASTSVGWGEPCAWTSHQTPKTSSGEVPLAPELQVEPMNCTTLAVRWRLAPGRSVTGLQGFKLFYHEESQPESLLIQLPPNLQEHTIEGLDPRKKYHVKLLAFNLVGDGYQADRTVSTPGCVSVRDRLVPPPPPPHHVFARANGSTSVHLHWARPAFNNAQTINYTVRCNPVGLQNASLVLYLQTGDQSLLVKDLEANTRYEFAVRLHVDQRSSPWSPVVYQDTLPDALALPPAGVKVVLIEGDAALVSWKPPSEPDAVVTHYTVLYASRESGLAGDWQVLQKEGSVTMALLENLRSGDVYLVKVSAANRMGDGPFSPAVELTVGADPHGPVPAPHFRSSAHSTVSSDLDHASMTGIIVGVSIAIACIIVCAFILVRREKTKKLCISKITGMGESRATPTTAGPPDNQSQPDIYEVMEAAMSETFIDTKAPGLTHRVRCLKDQQKLLGGTDLIVSGFGPVRATRQRKKKKEKKRVKKSRTSSLLYLKGSTARRCPAEPVGSSSLKPRSLQRPLPQQLRRNVKSSNSSESSREFSHYVENVRSSDCDLRFAVELEELRFPSAAREEEDVAKDFTAV